MSKPRRFYMDLAESDHPRALHQITAGDVLCGPNVLHRVVECWPTETRQPVNRWTCVVERVGPRPTSADDWRELHDRLGNFRLVEYRPWRRGEPR